MELFLSFSYIELNYDTLPTDTHSASDQEDPQFFQTPNKITLQELCGRFHQAKSIKHPNIASLIHLERLGKNRGVIVSQSCQTDLQTRLQFRMQLLNRANNHPFTQQEILLMGKSILSALCHQAKLGYPLLNIQPSNILINEDQQIKLAYSLDIFFFGFQNLPWRNPIYKAPQQEKNEIKSYFKIDIWSLGLIFLQCLTLTRIQNEQPLQNRDFKTEISQQLQQTLDWMLKQDPSERPDCFSLINHHPFSEIPQTNKKPVDYSLDDLYYIWSKHKGLNQSKQLQHYWIALGLIPFTPPVLTIPTIINLQSIKTQNPIELVNRKSIRLNFINEFTTQNRYLSEHLSQFQSVHKRNRPGSLKSFNSDSSSLSSNVLFTKSTNKFQQIKFAIKGDLQKLKEVAKQGIPPPLRKKVWPRLLEIPKGKKALFQFLQYSNIPFEIKQISLDIPRCHQYHLLLSSQYGKNALQQILKLYLNIHPIKYIQGLDSILAILLSVFQHRTYLVYFVFESLINKYLYWVLSEDQNIKYTFNLFRNILNFIDPILGQHLFVQQILPEMYASSWLLTLYSRKLYSDTFPASKAQEIWDKMFTHPFSFLYLLGISFLCQFRKQILQSDHNQLISFLVGITSLIDLSTSLHYASEILNTLPQSIFQISCQSYSYQVAQHTRVPQISLEQASERPDCIFVDLRESQPPGKTGLKNSISMPIRITQSTSTIPKIRLSEAQIQSLKKHTKNKIVVLIGNEFLSQNSVIFKQLGNILVKFGFSKVCLLQQQSVRNLNKDYPNFTPQLEEKKSFFSSFKFLQQMSLLNFQFLSKLGEGAYSTVFKVRRKSDGQQYALKKVRFAPLKEKQKSNALTQIRILASVNHPNVVGYKQAFLDQSTNTLCIIMDFADKGDLQQKISNHKKRRTFFSQRQIWSLAVQATRGLKALHDLKILHRDLKSANIFMWKDGSVKIGDMNVSKVAKQGLVYTQTGTPYYASPEVWSDKPYDSKSDIWSLGCVLYQAAALRPPFQANDMKSLFRKVTKGDFLPIPSSYSADLQEFIKSLLKVNSKQRPSCQQILNFPVIQSYSQEQVQTITDNLLKTIELPNQIKSLSSKLPAPKYKKELKLQQFGVRSSSNSVQPQEISEQNPLRTKFSSYKQIRLKAGIDFQEPLRAYNNQVRNRPSYSKPRIVQHSSFAQGTLASRIQALKAQYDNIPPVVQRQSPYNQKNIRPNWWG